MARDTRKWHRYLRFWRANVAADIDDELAFHVDARTDELCALGIERSAARARAIREFGDMNRTRATLRTMDEHHAVVNARTRIAMDLTRDFRLAARSLLRSPGVVAVVVLTFALGIGVTSAIYGVVDAFLFRPLPGRYGGELIVLGRTDRATQLPHQLSYPDYKDYRADTATFASLTAYSSRFVDLESNDRSERIYLDDATANYFATLGLAPILGRVFSAGDDEGTLAHPELVLSYKGWITHFSGDSNVIGRVVRINGHPATVIGVMPPRFHGVRPLIDIDAVAPMNQVWPALGAALTDRAAIVVDVFGRLRPRVGLGAARNAVHLRARQLARAYPITNAAVGAVVVPERLARPAVSVSGMTAGIAAVFMALVLLVLLVACANVASVLLARVVLRSRELAIRAALGASSWRLTRQAIVECTLLAILGGTAALPVTYMALRAIQSVHFATDLPVSWGIGLDARIVTFTAIAALTSAVAAGLAPATAARARDLHNVLKSSVGNSANKKHARMRSTLVVAQIAVSFVVLVCAGLFARSARNAMRADFGFETDHIAMASMALRAERYDTTRARLVYRDVLARVATIPGVRSVGLTAYLPFGYSRANVSVYPIASAVPTPADGFNFFYNVISGDYFATLAIPVLSGRAFVPGDSAGARQVAVVNDALARTLWPGENSIGKQFHWGGAASTIIEVVGVVRGMQDLIPGETPKPYIFRPLSQAYRGEMTLVANTSRDARAALSEVRSAMSAEDAAVPVFDVRTMEEHMRNGQALLFPRIASAFAMAFGLLALVLATIGMYGVVAYTVAQRTREIGVRVALGARTPAILRLVLGQGLRLAGIGGAIGLVLAFAATSTLRAILFGVEPRDPIVFGSVIVVVATIVGVASVVPARRAVGVDPVRALREG
jgi:predicted permease